jgi:hypothetical protein
MALLSGFVTLAARRLLIAMELDVGLAERFGRPAAPRIVDVFGFGAAHAFGTDDLRLRLDWLADLPEAMRAPVEEQARKMTEFAVLAGSGSGLPIPDVDLSQLRPLHEEYAERESTISAYLSELAPTTSANYLDWEEAQDLAPSLNVALPRAGITPDEFFSLGRDGIVEVMSVVPSHHILHELRRAHHENPQMPWDRGHVNDLGALSTAIVYCDVVVTERRWVDLGHRRRLDERFSTVLVADLADLPDVLAVS